jgi:hypothetical protein
MIKVLKRIPAFLLLTFCAGAKFGAHRMAWRYLMKGDMR